MPDITITKDHMRLLELNEGFRSLPYKDTLGYLTIGYGTNLSIGITRDEAQLLAAYRLRNAWTSLVKYDPWITILDPVRQAAIMDLVYNLGLTKWLIFRRTRAALAAGDFEEAAEGLRASRWCGQVKSRCPRIINMIVTGLWPWDIPNR